MCKVADVARVMVNHSIDYAYNKNDPRYYIDFYKLHKLLYYAQGYMLTHYKQYLFEEDIEARECGPYIPALISLPLGGQSIIKTKFPDGLISIPLDLNRIMAIDCTLMKYGTLTKDDLVHQSVHDKVYIESFRFSGSGRNAIISKSAMAEALDIFGF